MFKGMEGTLWTTPAYLNLQLWRIYSSSTCQSKSHGSAQSQWVGCHLQRSMANTRKHTFCQTVKQATTPRLPWAPALESGNRLPGIWEMWVVWEGWKWNVRGDRWTGTAVAKAIPAPRLTATPIPLSTNLFHCSTFPGQEKNGLKNNLLFKGTLDNILLTKISYSFISYFSSPHSLLTRQSGFLDSLWIHKAHRHLKTFALTGLFS